MPIGYKRPKPLNKRPSCEVGRVKDVRPVAMYHDPRLRVDFCGTMPADIIARFNHGNLQPRLRTFTRKRGP